MGGTDDGDRPKLKLARRTALAPILTDHVAQHLRPVFETRIERTRMPLAGANGAARKAFAIGYLTGREGARVDDLPHAALAAGKLLKKAA